VPILTGENVTYVGDRWVWTSYGRLHRLDGPAVITDDGAQEWYRQGAAHREDGPAVIRPDGTKRWFFDGRLHRVDGPALIDPDGSRFWCQDGLLHRMDGPALIKPPDQIEWFVSGEAVTERVVEWIERLSLPPYEAWGDVEKTLFSISFPRSP
jgi:hypothetical protein